MSQHPQCSMDYLEDAADTLEKHDGAYMLIAPGTNGCTFRCSRLLDLEQLAYFKREFEAYFDYWSTRLPPRK